MVGLKSQKSGKEFEKRVRKDLEEKGWIVDKFNNNVQLVYSVDENKKDERVEAGKLIIAKNKWSGPGRPMMLGAGFPDFIAFFKIYAEDDDGKCLAYMPCYEIMGVESKMRGILDKAEKQKCKWLLDNNIFSKIVIAHKGEKRGEISYKEFNT